DSGMRTELTVTASVLIPFTSVLLSAGMPAHARPAHNSDEPRRRPAIVLRTSAITLLEPVRTTTWETFCRMDGIRTDFLPAIVISHESSKEEPLQQFRGGSSSLPDLWTGYAMASLTEVGLQDIE